MTDDEAAIHDLVATWMQASAAGDTETVLGLMADDVIFMVPGREPFGKEAFRNQSDAMKGMTIRGTNEIRELKVLGDFAYARTYIEVTMTPADRAYDPANREPARRQDHAPSTESARSDAKPVPTFADRAPIHRKGYTLTLFRKDAGRWLLVRDANLLTAA